MQIHQKRREQLSLYTQPKGAPIADSKNAIANYTTQRYRCDWADAIYTIRYKEKRR